MNKIENDQVEVQKLGDYTISFTGETLRTYQVSSDKSVGFILEDEESGLIVANIFLDDVGNLDITTFYYTNYRIKGKYIEVILDSNKI